MGKIFIFLSLILFFHSTLAVIPGALVYDPTVDWDILQTFVYFETEIANLESQLSDLDKQLDAIKQLSPENYQWSNTSELINQLGETLEQANALSYAAQDIDKQFHSLFPGYVPLDNYSEQYQKITQSSLDTINNVLKTLGMSSADFSNENSRLKLLQNYSQNVVGQTQAIQVANQIASEGISQLQLIRQTIMAQANSQALFYAQQIQRDAASAAELVQTISRGDISTTGDLSQHPLSKPNYRN